MIYLTGDLHGDPVKLDIFYEKTGKHLTRNDYVIILGDFGMVWSADEQYGYFGDMVRIYDYFENKYPWTTLFIDGNHENFVHLKKFRKKEWNGGTVSFLTEHCIWLRRGQIYTIDGSTFLTIGGAYSIDKAWRTPLVSWWKDEAITRRDINTAKKNLALYNNKVDYILTHCAPTFVHHIIARQEKYNDNDHGYKPDSKNEALLQEIDEATDFKQWYFGHYHINREFENKKYVCLYHEIRPLP